MINILKHEAAARLLKSAIEIYAADGDILAIHILASSAFQLIGDLEKHKFHKSDYFERTLNSINKDMSPSDKKSINEAFKKSFNFMKHADRDPNETLKHDPNSTRILLLMACHSYYEISKEAPQIFSTYVAWFKLKNPTLLSPSHRAELINFAGKNQIPTDNKGDFFKGKHYTWPGDLNRVP